MQVSSQISDLRSTVSKEACRTVAILARALRSHFSPLAEVWIPAVIKLCLVKIAVVSVAGDRCMRIIIASGAPGGFPRVVPILLETLASKNAILRKHCMEYLTLAAAIWEPDSAFERQVDGIKKAVKAGLTDADANARKTARYLYWVLRRRSSWQRSMDTLLSDLDSSVQRHVNSEAAQSSELVELLNNSAALANIDSYEPVFSGGSPVSKSFQRLHSDEIYGGQTSRDSSMAMDSQESGMRNSFNKIAPAAASPVVAEPPPPKPMTRVGATRAAAAPKTAEAPPLPEPRDEWELNVGDSAEDAPVSQLTSRRMSVAGSSRAGGTSALGASRRMSVGPTRLAQPATRDSAQSGEGMRR
jgi:hypothetical protein